MSAAMGFNYLSQNIPNTIDSLAAKAIPFYWH